MTSSELELKKISTELSHVSLQMCQLHEQKKFLRIVQELRNRAEFEKTEEATENQHEINRIEKKLKELEDRKFELQQRHDRLLNNGDSKNNTEGGGVLTRTTSASVFYVEAPPTVPAPVVILDLENLPPHPCKTQCPQCQEFVTTETYTSVSSVTWLVCFMTALIGCVAGCCFIPFCLDSLKSITHRCPKCRSSIRTLKKL